MKYSKPKILAVVSFLLALLILYYKRPDAFFHSQFWAEEGSVYFPEAYHFGFKSIFNTCLGYFHLYPRLVYNLALVSGIPMAYMPIVSCYAWLTMYLLVFIYIWNRIELDTTKLFFIALTTVLLPMQAEVIMNLTNVQWIMALFPIVIFSSTNRVKNKRWFWADLFILFLTAFTGPNLLVLSPLIFIMAYKERKQYQVHKQALLLLVLLSLFFTLTSLVSYGSVSRTIGMFNPLDPAFIEYIYLQYAFLFFGKLTYITPWFLQVVFVLFLLFIFLHIFYKIVKGHIKSSFDIFVFFSGLLYLITTLYVYRFNPTLLDPRFGAMRNFYIPALCFLWLLTSRIQAKYKPILIFTLLSILFAYENVSCIGREEFIDYKWAAYSKKIKSCDTLSIPINPVGWHLVINNTIKVK